MVRLVRGTPVVRGVATAIAAILGLCGLIPLLAYPLLRLDASSYSTAIGDAAKECAGDPIPARGGCWSAAPARVTVSGVDADSGAAFAVVEVGGQPSVREDFVSPPPPDVAVNATLTARYWHDSIAELLLPPAAKGADPLVLPTRDNPVYRAASFPTASAVLFAVGLAGLLFWGRPLLADVRDWRNRRRAQAEAYAAIADSTRAATLNRGLARYGITLRNADLGDDVELTGRRSVPPPPQPQAAPPAQPAHPAQQQDGGGPGWSIRPY